MKYYTGIGSRSTPKEILTLMTALATKLAPNYTLRSGGANGADTAFELGAGTNKNIYLPWRGFNNSSSNLYVVTVEALELAQKYHPAWYRLSQGAKKLMARNMYQVTGQNLATPSNFLVCYTPNGELVGGTAQAIKYALDNNIEVINLGSTAGLERVKQYIS